MQKLNSKQLRKSGRNIKLPIQITFADGQYVLVCQEILRLLPGKRLTCKAVWQGREVVAKLFYAPFKHAWHWQRDKQGIEALLTKQFRTANIIFAKRDVIPGLSILILDYLAESVNLRQSWPQAVTDEEQQDLLCRLLITVAQLHGAGLFQKDIHFDNFLCYQHHIHIIDGAGICTTEKKALCRRKSLKNLGLLFAHIKPSFDHIMPIAFQAYVAERGWACSDRLLHKMKQQCKYQRYRHEKYVMKKLYRNCSNFIQQKSFRHFIIYDRHYTEQILPSIINDPEWLFHSKQSKMVKDGNSSTLVQYNQQILLKRHNIKTFMHGLRRLIQPSRASNSWRFSHLLQLRGIATARPLALLESRFGIFRWQAYFICEYIKGETLDVYLSKQSQQQQEWQPMLEQIVDIFRQLWQAKISHGDTKASNFIIRNEQVYLLDLDGMRRYRRKSVLRQAWRRDMKRFLQNLTEYPLIQEYCAQLLQQKGLIV